MYIHSIPQSAHASKKASHFPDNKEFLLPMLLIFIHFPLSVKFSVKTLVMSSQLSSTTITKKCRKLVDSDADEVLVIQKKQEVTATKTVSISIPNLLKKINDETLTIAGGRDFKIRNKEVFIGVLSKSPEPGYIEINIVNSSKGDVVLSLDWKETPPFLPPPDFFHKKMRLRARSVTGWSAMSYDDYKQWAMEHGDVFKLKVTITLHLKESSNQWTNLR